jgi:hypothetical protein
MGSFWNPYILSDHDPISRVDDLGNSGLGWFQDVGLGLSSRVT